jgi:O-methyltransferase involved in polyketide biosynthesis
MTAVCQSPGPYCFVAEAVFIYLTEQEVKAALAQIAGNFPAASIIFDRAPRKVIERLNRDHARQKLDARFTWACDDPRDIERWGIGLRLAEYRTLTDIRDSLRSRLSWPLRAAFAVLATLFPRFMRAPLILITEAAHGDHAVVVNPAIQERLPAQPVR